jgi:hypothetical protein
MDHLLHCRCGTLRGSVAGRSKTNRVVCYCSDCQAFAHFLGGAGAILDERGGSDIVQVLPKNIAFSQGTDALACMRLTPKGLLRWYASCCNTPIGNTLATAKLSFIGLLHSCLTPSGTTLDAAFGPVVAWVNTKGARGSPKPRTVGQGRTIGWFLGTALPARFNGDYRRTPFFRIDTGAPVVMPRVLSESEHADVRRKVCA